MFPDVRLKPGSHIVVIIGNRKQVQVNIERNLSSCNYSVLCMPEPAYGYPQLRKMRTRLKESNISSKSKNDYIYLNGCVLYCFPTILMLVYEKLFEPESCACLLVDRTNEKTGSRFWFELTNRVGHSGGQQVFFSSIHLPSFLFLLV